MHVGVECDHEQNGDLTQNVSFLSVEWDLLRVGQLQDYQSKRWEQR